MLSNFCSNFGLFTRSCLRDGRHPKQSALEASQVKWGKLQLQNDNESLPFASSSNKKRNQSQISLTLPLQTTGSALDPRKHFVYLEQIKPGNDRRTPGSDESIPRSLSQLDCFDSVFQVFNQTKNSEMGKDSECFSLLGHQGSVHQAYVQLNLS